MDAFFSKLKSTVAEALPGIPLSQDYEVHELKATAGPGRLWKVHHGIQKSTKQAVSLFIFEKKSIDKLSRDERKQVVEVLRQGAHQLTRLRHPKILSVVRPLEENRDCLCFATEPVLGSLADVIYGRGNTTTSDDGSSSSRPKAKLDDIEIKYGLLQILEGLSFLHSDAKIVHGGLCLSSIIINGNGMWKLCCFEFAVPSGNGPGQPGLYACKPWTSSQCMFAQPDLDYTAPEWVLSSTCDTMSDMFSLGVVIHALYNEGKPVFQCDAQLATYKSKAAELKRIKMSSLLSVPENIREFVNLMLNSDRNVRPDAGQLAKVPYFESVPVATLQYVDTLVQRDNLQKSQFFKELPKILEQLPLRLCLLRVLPALFHECYNHDMIPFVLANVVAMVKRSSDDEYTHYIFPNLIPLFKISKPIQVPLIFMQNMALLLSKTATADIKSHVLPMVYRSLEMHTENMQLQELCLSILPSFSNLIDQAAMKNAVIPRIKKLCTETGVLSVRVQCLVCLGKILEHIDKWVVVDDILPFLATVPSREAAVLMSILGIYKVAFSHASLGISKEMLATKVLPFLVPLCTDSCLNLMQFNAYMTVIKEMLAKVEAEHRSKLEHMHHMEQEQRSLNIGSPSGGSSKEDTMTDSFLHSVGLMMTSAPAAGGGGSGSSHSLSNGNARNHPTVKPSMQHVPNPASAVTASATTKVAPLSLEEKQRLVREQELQERMRSEQQLAPVVATSSGSTQHPNSASRVQPPPQVKDLTKTLAASTAYPLHQRVSPAGAFSGSSLSSSQIPSPALSNGAATDSLLWSGTSPMLRSAAPNGAAYQHPSAAATLGTGSAVGWPQSLALGGRAAGALQAQQPSLDLSAFDSLLTLPSSQRPRAPTAHASMPSVAASGPPRLQSPMTMQSQFQASSFSGYGQQQQSPGTTIVNWGALALGTGNAIMPSESSGNKLNAKDISDLLG